MVCGGPVHGLEVGLGALDIGTLQFNNLLDSGRGFLFQVLPFFSGFTV